MMQLPQTVPVFPLAGALLLPRGRLPLQIFEPRYLAMVDDALRGHRMIGMVQPLAGQDQLPLLYATGCVGRIVHWSESSSDSICMISLLGISRFRIARELDTMTAYRQVVPDYTPFGFDATPMDNESAVDRKRLAESIPIFFRQRKMENYWPSIEHSPGEALINTLSMICPFPPAEKQALLDAPTLVERAQLLTALIEMTIAGRGSPTGAMQ